MLATRIEAGRVALDRQAASAAALVLPFYRRFPYRGPMGLFEVDPRGAYSPLDGFFYNRVPKAANSTVMRALAARSAFRRRWARDRTKSRFLRPSRMGSADVARLEAGLFAFTVVRDPYRRVLSAFLDKVGKDRRQGRAFRAAHGPGEPGFLDFLRWLEAGGLHADPHWAPQVDLMLLPLERFDLIGRVERLDADLGAAIARIFDTSPPAVAERAGPRTDSQAAFEASYDREAIALVNRLYVRDFIAFGYEMREV